MSDEEFKETLSAAAPDLLAALEKAHAVMVINDVLGPHQHWSICDCTWSTSIRKARGLAS